ncbi:MAG: 16S rRNA (adenine(1518)-N(6)/adenine(1519)-N(6))-dimethyltransferase RsmA [Candidatus Sumerlaeaceae bacterium]
MSPKTDTPSEPERTRLTDLLRRHGLKTTKSLGQHFLIDDEVLHTIAHSLEPGPGSDVVEIGSGAGNLAVMLSLSGAKVTALEVDRKFELLHREIQLSPGGMTERLRWQYMDALDFDYAAAARATHELGRRFLIAGNIPYQITSPLIMKILESGAAFDCMVLMIQREVAERLAATPGGRKSGAITIKVQYYCTVEPVLDVPPEAFLPPPEVHSRVLRFVRKESDMDHNPPKFFRLVEAAFMHRRKTLVNAVSSGTLGYSREQLEEALAAIGLSARVRAEELGVAAFIALQQHLDGSAAAG